MRGLEHHPDVGLDAVQGEILVVVPGHENLPALGLVEAGQQIDDRRLARSRRAAENREQRGVETPKSGKQVVVDLVEQRRDQMINGDWDPFTEHAFVSNGTGLELDGTPIPAAGTEVKPAGEVPTDEWLLSLFNFDLAGVEILE